ncbi:MAG: glutamate N-acetyltransferase/amino-acid N-acetyltransferase [Kiritimatiellia bacterium]|jgi:glutamate N-acetyltransferase/amino-acid N-acetyltransferase
MAVGNVVFPEMQKISGIKLNAISAGIKKNNQLDVMLIELPATVKVAGVFTQNAFCAAPVVVCKQHLSQQPRYLLVNSGNANACTGEQGIQDALHCCEAVSASSGSIHTSVQAQQVLPFSTGVIGEPLPTQKIIEAVPELFNGLEETNWLLAAQGIMTTDTQAKGASRCFEYQGETIIVNGIAKGAGMINPHMATMLGFIATNAHLSQTLLDNLSFNAANQSFNRITIDGDTSTNDSCILMASGASSFFIDDSEHELFALLETAVFDVYRLLAQAIVRDGEGATKFVAIQVEGGATADECLQVAYAIAHSPLVKTALFASDPNWGRIVAAIGYAGVDQLDADAIRLYLDDVLIVENGGRAASYTEAAGQQVMDKEEILLRVCLGRGTATETIWTTDLSHEYVTINADYRS